MKSLALLLLVASWIFVPSAFGQQNVISGNRHHRFENPQRHHEYRPQQHHAPPSFSWGITIGPPVGFGIYGNYGYGLVPPYYGAYNFQPQPQVIVVCPPPQILWQTPYETRWYQPPCEQRIVW